MPLDAHNRYLDNFNTIETPMEYLQITSNGFSRDYVNKIQALYMSFHEEYGNVTYFFLPSYDEYIQEKISQYQSSYPDVDLKHIYYNDISNDKIHTCNNLIAKVNLAIKTGADEDEIRDICQNLIQQFFTDDYYNENITSTRHTIRENVHHALHRW